METVIIIMYIGTILVPILGLQLVAIQRQRRELERLIRLQLVLKNLRRLK